MHSNNNSWPHQKFHNANKSVKKSNSAWESRFHQYNDSGKIQSTIHKYGVGATTTPRSFLCEASYDCKTQECTSFCIKSQ